MVAMAVAVGGRENMCGGVGESGSQMKKEKAMKTKHKEKKKGTNEVKLRKKRTTSGTWSG